MNAFLICALCQALWSAPSIVESAYADPSSRVTWSPANIYEVGAIVNYAAADYISLTKNVGMTPDSSSTDWAILDSGPRVTYAGPYVAARRYSANDVVTESGISYIAVTNVQREDPANDVRFSVGNWAIFSAENPRWTITANGTAATQPSGAKRSSTSQSLQRPAEPTAVEPKNKLQARDAFPGCNNVAQQLDPFYQSQYPDCGTVRTRTDYGVIGSMLILSLFLR